MGTTWACHGHAIGMPWACDGHGDHSNGSAWEIAAAVPAASSAALALGLRVDLAEECLVSIDGLQLVNHGPSRLGALGVCTRV